MHTVMRLHVGLQVACTPHILIGVLAHASPDFKALLQTSVQQPEQLLKDAWELAASLSSSSSSGGGSGGEALGQQPPSAQAQVRGVEIENEQQQKQELHW